jgi:chitodextrinase
LGQPDTTPPTAPINPALGNATASSLTFTWSPATDNLGVAGYRIDVATDAAFAQLLTGYSGKNMGKSTALIAGLSPGATYYARVRAFDAAGNTGPNSVTASGTTLGPPDATAPTAPSNPVLYNATSVSLVFSWKAATDNVGVVGYRIDLSTDPSFIGFVPGYAARNVGNRLGLTITGLNRATKYYARVRAFDLAGNTGMNSAPAQGATLP